MQVIISTHVCTLHAIHVITLHLAVCFETMYTYVKVVFSTC